MSDDCQEKVVNDQGFDWGKGKCNQISKPNSMKTTKEINDLKINWIKDPIWDIETTEGFEDHKDDLLEFSIKMKEKWEMNRRKRLEQMGLGLEIDNLKMVAFLEMLQNRIIELENKFR